MVKALERAKFTATTNTRRRRSALILQKIESQLTKNILAQSLALQVIRNSQKPTSQLIEELIGIEARVGEFVGEALHISGGEHSSSVDLRGILAGAMSFIPMNPFRSKSSLKSPMRKQLLEVFSGAFSKKPSLPKECPTDPTQLLRAFEIDPLTDLAVRKTAGKKVSKNKKRGRKRK